MFLLKLFLLFGLSTIVVSYKILGIYQLPTGSHYILATRLFKEIAKKGHHVTFFTPYEPKEKLENITQITIPGIQDVVKEFSATLVRQDQTPFERAVFINNIQFEVTKHVLASKEMQNLLHSNQQFDAVIIYQYLNEAFLPIGGHFKAPIILFNSMPLYVTESFLLKHPAPSSYVPNILHEYTGRMSFWQRLRNSFYDVCMIAHYLWFMLPKHRELAFRYIPGSLDVYDYLTNASLVLINSHVSTNEAVPLVPNAVEIGGYHIEESKPLPLDLQKYIDESKDGVILFSMGSITKSVDFPKVKRDALLATFSKLKENVLWKWEGDEFPDKPKNVKLMKWIPQSDVLAHPNVKAFISHGGLLSTMESVYHAKPLIGIPVFVDQMMNMALAKAYEYAVEVPYKDLSEKTLTQALEQIFNNSKYKENIQQRSKILRDQPLKPSEKALYWIEYVIQHKGAPHLRYPGMDLNWFQRNLIDVAAFVLATISTVLFLVYKVIKLFCTTSYKQKNE